MPSPVLVVPGVANGDLPGGDAVAALVADGWPDPATCSVYPAARALAAAVAPAVAPVVAAPAGAWPATGPGAGLPESGLRWRQCGGAWHWRGDGDDQSAWRTGGGDDGASGAQLGDSAEGPAIVAVGPCAPPTTTTCTTSTAITGVGGGGVVSGVGVCWDLGGVGCSGVGATGCGGSAGGGGGGGGLSTAPYSLPCPGPDSLPSDPPPRPPLFSSAFRPPGGLGCHAGSRPREATGTCCG